MTTGLSSRSTDQPPVTGGRPDLSRVFRLFDTVLVVIIALVLVGVGYVALHAHRFLGSSSRVLLLLVAPLSFAVGLAATFRLRAEVRASLVMILVFSAVALYAVELFLVFRPVDRLMGRTGIDYPAGYDRRPLLQVVLDLRADGQDAYPALVAQGWMDAPLLLDGDPVVPLSGVAHAITVECNESGTYLMYESDRFGFNNPDDVWDVDRPDLLLVGDSFTEGACVSPERSMASLIRAQHPRMVNIGYGSNGPLTELAGLREYGAALRPRDVVWFFYGFNDLPFDLSKEVHSDLMTRYLADPAFSQDLRERSGDIEAAMRSRVDATMERLARLGLKGPGPSLLDRVRDVVTLQELRSRLGLRLDRPTPDQQLNQWEARPQWEVFGGILAEANDVVASWGGTLHLVYLPGRDSFAKGIDPPFREEFRALAESLHVPLIDVYPAFASADDPMSLFPPKLHGSPWWLDLHYNEEGHRLAAETVLSGLDG
jgi:lysophospholipase L1-like esterase